MNSDLFPVPSADANAITVRTVDTARRDNTRNMRILLSNEALTYGDALLESTIGWQLRFICPDTWTQDEIRDQFANGMTELMASPGVSRFLLLMTSVPPEIVPSVLEQFEEIAEYETRMWETRLRNSDGNRMKERRVVLPLADQ